MAFVSETNTYRVCPICSTKLTMCMALRKGAPLSTTKFEYKHPDSGLIMVNGYPSPCPNNGGKLAPGDTEKIRFNIINGYRVYS